MKNNVYRITLRNDHEHDATNYCIILIKCRLIITNEARLFVTYLLFGNNFAARRSFDTTMFFHGKNKNVMRRVIRFESLSRLCEDKISFGKRMELKDNLFWKRDGICF